MLKRIISILCLSALLLTMLGGCGAKDTAKIGVSFGVGSAARWPMEEGYMKERAEELGIEIETRLNTSEAPKTQTEDCIEMIDSGIDVLILIPRDANNVGEILEYAAKKKVKVLSYARVVLGEKVDLFVGYDSDRIGQMLGQYLSEMVYEGDYILLEGDPNDNNATLLHGGAMRYINSIRDDINIILDDAVIGWDAELAKQMVKDAVSANDNQINAILAPNDKIAGACAEALAELGVTEPVVITGMDTELSAVKRIVAGTQDCTVYMDLRDLSRTAVDEAYHMAMNEKVNVNATFDNQSPGGIPANLITGKLITKQNLDKLLIESGYFTHEEVYGS